MLDRDERTQMRRKHLLGDAAREPARRGDAERSGHRMAAMAAVRREIARCQAAAVAGGRKQPDFGQDMAGDIAEAHAPASFAADRFETRQQIVIGIEFGRRLVARKTEVDGP